MRRSEHGDTVDSSNRHAIAPVSGAESAGACAIAGRRGVAHFPTCSEAGGLGYVGCLAVEPRVHGRFMCFRP